MKNWTSILVALVLMVSLAAAAEKVTVKPGEGDKCPVCGMFVAKYPDFVAQVAFKDGSYAFFDGVKDMMKYYFDLPKYNASKKMTDINSLLVTDYYSMKLIDGFAAYYVVGSDVLGPMGRELIPFGEEAAAQEFLKDHRGKTLVRFQDITVTLVKSLD